MKTEAVTLDIPVEGKEAPYKHNYSKQVAESVQDIKAISDSRAKGDTDDEKKKSAAAYTVRAFNYGHDLLVRQAERQKATRAAQGPEKQIAKSVEMLVSNGMEAGAARALIIAQREAAGLPV